MQLLAATIDNYQKDAEVVAMNEMSQYIERVWSNAQLATMNEIIQHIERAWSNIFSCPLLHNEMLFSQASHDADVYKEQNSHAGSSLFDFIKK